MAISFKTTNAEEETIHAISKRAERMAFEADLRVPAYHFAMDVTACHANGCPLDLVRLLSADDFNFAHDVFGIGRHLNRDTGQLEDCFLPRFAKPQAA